MNTRLAAVLAALALPASAQLRAPTRVSFAASARSAAPTADATGPALFPPAPAEVPFAAPTAAPLAAPSAAVASPVSAASAALAPASAASIRLAAMADVLAPRLAAMADSNSSNESASASAQAASNLVTNERAASSSDGVLAPHPQAQSADLLTRLGLHDQILAGAGIVLGHDGKPAPVSEPIHFSAFDNDDNVAYYNTKIYVRHKVTGAEVGIPTSEFAEVRKQIGESGKYKDYQYFDLDKPYGGSFRDFRDINDSDIFVKDMDDSIKMPAASWRGPSWFRFALALKNAKTAPWVAIVTSRGHESRNMVRGFDELKKRGLLASSPRPEMIFGVSSEKVMKSLPADMGTPEKKVEVLIAFLDLLESVPLANPGDRHTFGFSDDDLDMITRVRNRLVAEVAKNRWPHVRISVFSTGPGRENVEVLEAPAAK